LVSIFIGIHRALNLLKQLLSLDLFYTQKVYDFQYTKCIDE